MNRQWMLAFGAGALLSGIALYVITLVAVPTTMVLGSQVPTACVYGSSQQACADATARLGIMQEIQPISWFVVAVGGVVMAYAALSKPATPGGADRVKQPKRVETATCGNCGASVPDNAVRCPSCGVEFDESA